MIYGDALQLACFLSLCMHRTAQAAWLMTQSQDPLLLAPGLTNASWVTVKLHRQDYRLLIRAAQNA